MESTTFKKTDYPHIVHFTDAGYSFKQLNENQIVQSQVPAQHLNSQFNPEPGHYSKQMDVSLTKHYPPMPQPPVSSNDYHSRGSSHPSVVGSIHFKNPGYGFQPFLPTLVPSVSTTPLHSSVSSTQNNHRPLFNLPPPSTIPARSVDPMLFGQFNFPPPPIPSPQFSPRYVKNAPPFSNNAQQYFKSSSAQTVFPTAFNFTSTQSPNFQSSTISQMISNFQSSIADAENNSVISEKEKILNRFLQKFKIKEKHETKSNISVAEFHSGLKKCFTFLNLLEMKKNNLVSLLDSDQEKWDSEFKQVNILQNLLSEACSVVSVPKNVTTVQKKLMAIKKKRVLKKKMKAMVLEQKMKKEQERERLHQEIDKWFDNLKEKNEKMKREIEMKKEADNILAEVRRKIHEAKKTIEKLKVFEKLRSARLANAVQKGLYLQPEHSEKFETKLSYLRETMLAQLSNYEQEEKALQVMLETEQEDRREEEALWRKRKLMTLQQKKQKAILKSLFGDSEEPALDDPLFLFYQYQNSGNKSIDNLLQIRHHWDIHQSKEGESIPSQWVVPVPPSNSSWEEYCTN